MAVDPRAHAVATPRRFASAVASAVNEIKRRSPAPRDLPFFGVDHPPGTGSKLLDRLSELGIFRIYERVLDLSAGLGGPARWLARRRGCRVYSFDGGHERAAASRLLVRRAYLESAVSVAVARPTSLPVPSDTFTHAWSVESLAGHPERLPIFRELFRVVRPGGHVAVQEWVVAKDALALGGASYETAESHAEGLRQAGFADVRASLVGELREDESAISEIVSERVAELLGEGRPAERRALGQATAALEEQARAIGDGSLSLAQIFGRKPG
ncbi:MAG: class I SAM-dependent methyltransferase [Candidatus Binatia bacterium]